MVLGAWSAVVPVVLVKERHRCVFGRKIGIVSVSRSRSAVCASSLIATMRRFEICIAISLQLGSFLQQAMLHAYRRRLSSSLPRHQIRDASVICLHCLFCVVSL